MYRLPRFLSFVLLAFLTISASIAQSPDQSSNTIVLPPVKPPVSATPIAIVPFGWRSSLPQSVDLGQIVRSDLNRSGLFRALENLPSDRPTQGAEVNWDAWRAVRQDYLVVGKVLDAPNGAYRVEFELYRVSNQERLLGFAVSGLANDMRTVGHQISDMVFEKITGIRGAFDTRIAYVTFQKANAKPFRLIFADSDGVNPVTLAESSEPILSPAWSPDGRKLAYVSFERRRLADGTWEASNSSKVYIRDLNGAGGAVSTERGINGSPSFSPDGSKLALTLSRSGNPEIYTMDLISKQLTQLTRSFAIDTEATWMPNGREILFTSDRGGKPQIYRMNADGSNVARFSTAGRENARASVSADGKKVAMAQGSNMLLHIAVQDTERGNSANVSYGTLDECPSFAPNGTMILYASREAGRGLLYSISADGQVSSRLFIPNGDVREPAWGPYKSKR
jgi:TolB protein